METLRRTKLVCTLGPASARIVPDLVAAGMDVARVNLSHGTHPEHEALIGAVRKASAAARRPVAVLVDLPGPKIRVAAFATGSVDLEAGAALTLRPGWEGLGEAHEVGVAYPSLGDDVRVGDRILLADGAAELRVTGTGEAVETTVVRGGTIRSGAGVAIPADRLSSPALTERDLAHLPWIRSVRPDFVAQSFVRRADDISELRERLGPDGPSIIAKIETRPAVDDFDRILGVVDAVMIARGDLGVELPFEEVPLVQKRLVRMALDRGVPSIVATQMLESMTTSPRPTRAEASDVANAVIDGADAIMLSGETAIGAFPVLAAQAATRIAAVCEAQGAALIARGSGAAADGDVGPVVAAAVGLADADAALVGICCFTRTGRTARTLSSLRPTAPIFAFSPEPSVVRRLALAGGVMPRLCPAPGADTEPLAFVTELLAASGLVREGERAVILGSTGASGTEADVLAVRSMPPRPPAAP
jgi:pyruvate kinase